MSTDLVAYEPDLIFSSKIESVGVTAGVSVRIITDFDVLLRELKSGLPRVLVLNLDALAGRLNSVKELTGEKSCRVLGYYSHMNMELAEEAKRAGTGKVLSRGTFAAQIKELLTEAIMGA